MNTQDIIDCYNRTAKNYADKFGDELSKKHFDRILLRAFAAENNDQGKLIDLGCGPGQTTRFLLECGITDIIGIDLSPGMIEVARQLNPSIEFEIADMLSLPFCDVSFGSAVAFYSIVHFNEEQVLLAFREINRVLKPGGQLLFSFHIGDHTVHLDDFLDHTVNIDFNFFDTQKIVNQLGEAGFQVIDVAERQPYKDFEYPSIRGYIWASK